jgi:EmrB/QacA subfamily drug resistance transporter
MASHRPRAGRPARALTETEPTHRRRWWTLAVLCLSLLLTSIDTSIVNTALPTLAEELHADSTELLWIVDAYTLPFAAMLLVAGALGDRFGRQRMLEIGLVLFSAAALLAALSDTPGQLIAMRAVMGVAAACIMPATLGIVIHVFTLPAERAKAIAVWAAVSGIGVAIGPTTAGFLLEHFHWGMIFLINVPIVCVALAAGNELVPRSRDENPAPLDLFGALLSASALTLLVWALIEAPNHGWLSPTTLGAGAGALALGVAFAAWEVRTPHPMLALALFRNRRFSAASLSVSVLFFALFSSLFLLTQIFQFILGFSPLKTGLAALPFAVTLGVMAPVSAMIARRFGTKLPVACGLLCLGGALVLMSRATSASEYWFYLGPCLLLAMGIGLAAAPATQSIMGSLPPDKTSVGSAMNDTTREVGGVLGVAVVGSIVNSGYVSELRPSLEGLSAHQRDTAEHSVAGAASVAKAIGGADGGTLLQAAHDAFMAAATHGMLVAAAVAMLGSLFALRWLPARSAEEQAASVRVAPAPPRAERATPAVAEGERAGFRVPQPGTTRRASGAPGRPAADAAWSGHALAAPEAPLAPRRRPEAGRAEGLTRPERPVPVAGDARPRAASPAPAGGDAMAGDLELRTLIGAPRPPLPPRTSPARRRMPLPRPRFVAPGDGSEPAPASADGDVAAAPRA